MAIRLQMDVAEDLWPDQEFSLLGPDDYLERARRVAAEPGMDIHFYGDPAPVQSPTTREKEPKSSAQETRHRM
jgi:hypothetical protein